MAAKNKPEEKPKPSNVDILEKEFADMYETMDVRPGIRHYAREIAKAAYLEGLKRGQDRSF